MGKSKGGFLGFPLRYQFLEDQTLSIQKTGCASSPYFPPLAIRSFPNSLFLKFPLRYRYNRSLNQNAGEELP